MFVCYVCPSRYKPTITVEVVTDDVGFKDVPSCVEWLKEKGVVLTGDEAKIDCKASAAVVQAL